VRTHLDVTLLTATLRPGELRRPPGLSGPSPEQSVRWDELHAQVQVWLAELDHPPRLVEPCADLLSEPARMRIERYRTPELRSRHTVAAAALIDLIRLYTGTPAEQINLTKSELGKPTLTQGMETSRLQFSMAHSRDLAAYAFTADRPVGVDIEEIAAAPTADLLRHCLSEHEREWFSVVPPARRSEVFYQLWTIKEAYLKAIGTGLSISPAFVEIEPSPEGGYRFYRPPANTGTLELWAIFPFSPQPAYAGAVVVQAGPETVEYFRWHPQRVQDPV
jgi:4'-phosphopantetheinyl transferase